MLPDLQGKTDDDVFEPATAARMMALKRGVLEGHRAARERFEVAMNGQRRLYDFFMEPALEPNGDVTGVCCVAVDVTDVG